MLPVVVMPVLNEVEHLRETCRTLGFGGSYRRGEVGLILVDNGSTDGTLDVIEDVLSASAEGSVVVIRHVERGPVGARMAGMQAARAYARRRNVDPESALILQADADTIYEDGYVEAMTKAAVRFGRGILYEGASIPPVSFDDPCAEYRRLEALVDAENEMPADDLDMIVDDKVAAFLLADYEAWGGHRRERRGHPPHDEVLAETTRLFVRARCGSGARRVRVENACATTSSRRIVEDPALAFATAGFPREESWRRWWRTTYTGARTLDAFSPLAPREPIRQAIEVRRRHCEAMFKILPELVATACGTTCSGVDRVSDDVRPADLLDEAFRLAGVDHAPGSTSRQAAGRSSPPR